MIQSVTVTNHLGEKLRLQLDDPWTEGLLIANIDGLGPVKANINSTSLATTDGAVFTSARVDVRNIVLTIAMMGSPTIEESRYKLYRYFPTKKNVSLLVETDTRTAEVFGWVESNDPVIFSSEEHAQISILCPDPYFYAPELSEMAFSGVLPLFEFPFENEDLIEPTLEFGEVRLDTRANLVYHGDADTGILMTIHFIESGPEDITIYNVDTREKMAIDTSKVAAIGGKTLEKGDDILISTMIGNKYVRLYRDGKLYNIISAIGKDATWFQLHNGDNVFSFTAKSGEKDLMITFTYRNAYGGV